MKCPKCGSENTKNSGWERIDGKPHKRYHCRGCQNDWVDKEEWKK